MTTSPRKTTSKLPARKSQEKSTNSEVERMELIAKELKLIKGQIVVLRNEKGKVVESIIKTLILLLASTFICWQVWEIRVAAEQLAYWIIN